MAAPTISALADVSLMLNEALGATAITVGDDVTPVGDLTLTAESSDQAVVADGDITLGGTGANRTIALSPVSDAQGTAEITVTVDDGTATTSTTFTVTVAERIAVKAPANGLGRVDGQPVNGEAVAKNDDNDLPYLARVYVGGTGAVKVTTGDGDVVTFSGVPAGDVLPVLVRRVWSTGTTATNLVAVW